MKTTTVFKTDNFKYKNKESRTNIFNSGFNSAVSSRGIEESDTFNKNLPKWKDFIAWAIWYPDLWYDLITPETGGIRLDLDQRVYLRAMARFISLYGVFPRGYGKTFCEVLMMYHTAVFHPDIYQSMSAQTRENASKLLEEKHREILKFYPLMGNEIVKANFSKDSAEIVFTSGAIIDVLANNQNSKGARRHRMSIEEAALLNNALFQDALEPIPNIPRRTIGKKALINPEELNGQINFFTTSGFKGSDEYQRNLDMIDAMANLQGKIVLGSDWQLACSYGRGETKSQILDKKSRLSPISFAQNYESRWVGAVDNALVDINKLLALRTLPKCELKWDGKSEYVLGVDVARSVVSGNNQSSVAVLKLKRSRNGKVTQIMLVNLYTISNLLNFTAQAAQIKIIKKQYNAKVVICDSNGLGIGLVDELMKDSIDPLTGESLGCWNTINTDSKPESNNAETALYDLKPQSANSDIIVSFIDMVESGKLRLLEKRPESDFDIHDKQSVLQEAPFKQTDTLIEEISNLQLKPLSNGKVSIVKVINKYDKDRVSALLYGLWYIKTFEDNAYSGSTDLSNLTKYMKYMTNFSGGNMMDKLFR